MSILETTVGQATFSGVSAKCQCFFVPTRDQGGSELPLSQTIIQNQSAGIRAVQKLGSTPAGSGMNPSVVGQFYLTNYEVPDGTLLKIFCDRNIRGNRMIGNQYIRMNSGAAFQAVKGQLTGYPKAAVTECTFRGRFDIISPDEAKAHGARIPMGLEKFYTRQAVNSVFQYEVLSPALVTPTVQETRIIANSAGEKVAVVVSKPRRKLVVD